MFTFLQRSNSFKNLIRLEQPAAPAAEAEDGPVEVENPYPMFAALGFVQSGQNRGLLPNPEAIPVAPQPILPVRPQLSLADLKEEQIPQPNKLWHELDKAFHQRLIEDVDLPLPQRQWFLSGSCFGTSRWLMLGCSKIDVLLIPEEDYLDNLRLRLLIPLFYRDGDRVRTCLCNRITEGDDYGYHCLSCTRFRGVEARHEAIQTVVADFLMNLKKDPVTWETKLRFGSGHKGDLRFVENGKPTHIDITVINPTAEKYKWKELDLTTAGAPARLAEANKLVKYTEVKAAKAPNVELSLIPFVMEATGRMGPAADAFLDRLSKTTGLADESLKTKRNFFLSRLSVCMARGNAALLREYRARATLGERPIAMLPLQHPVPDPANDPSITQVVKYVEKHPRDTKHHPSTSSSKASLLPAKKKFTAKVNILTIHPPPPSKSAPSKSAPSKSTPAIASPSEPSNVPPPTTNNEAKIN